METSENSVTPDAIFQCDDNKKGVVCEIKTSLPNSEDLLLKDIKEQLEKYSKIQKGWKTKSKTVESHSILIVVHRTDSKKLDELLTRWKKNGLVNIDTNVCIAEWMPTRPLKTTATDLVLVSHRSGTTDCEYFDTKLKEDIEIDLDDIATEYNERRFVKSPPPDLYLMEMLYQNILPNFTNEKEEFEVNIDQLMEMLIEYYTSWSGLEGEQSQIRKKWIKNAMDKFCEIKLAEKISEENKYKVKWSKKIPKDVKEYILSKLCGKEPTMIEDLKQTKLTDLD